MINTAVQGLSEVAIAKLPPLKSMARTIRSVKNRSQAPRPNPNSLGELELPEELMSTLRNEPFLLYDSGPTDEKRAIMFGTSKNLGIATFGVPMELSRSVQYCLSKYGLFMVITEVSFTLISINY